MDDINLDLDLSNLDNELKAIDLQLDDNVQGSKTSISDSINTSALDTTAWTESLESNCGSIGNAKSFLWTAPSTGTVSIDLAGSTFDTVVSVKQAVCGAAAECNDDNYNSYYSLQSFPKEKL